MGGGLTGMFIAIIRTGRAHRRLLDKQTINGGIKFSVESYISRLSEY